MPRLEHVKYGKSRGSARVTQGTPATEDASTVLGPGLFHPNFRGARNRRGHPHSIGRLLGCPRTGDDATQTTHAGKNDVNLSNYPDLSTTTAGPSYQQTEPDWCVLVLYADETESNIKGIWGPYTDTHHVEQALAELQQWPLDGRWDVRRLNKFVARKAGNPPNSTAMWSWGGTDAIRTTN